MLTNSFQKPSKTHKNRLPPKANTISGEQAVSEPATGQSPVEGKRRRNRKADYYLLYDFEGHSSIKARVANMAIKILKEEPLLGERQLILKMIARDEVLRDYYMKKQDIHYFRHILWSLAKKKIILKAKIVGDDRHVYYFLPEQLDLLKDKIIKAPKKP